MSSTPVKAWLTDIDRQGKETFPCSQCQSTGRKGKTAMAKNVFEMVGELEKMGFKRWQKGGHDRLYVNADVLGLEVDYYKSGNVHSATFDGYSISNAEARRMMYSKTYIDLIARRIYSDNASLAYKVCDICGVEKKQDLTFPGKATVVNFTI